MADIDSREVLDDSSSSGDEVSDCCKMGGGSIVEALVLGLETAVIVYLDR